AFRPQIITDYVIWEIMDNLPIQIYFKDINCRFIYANKACAKSLGIYEPNSALGRTDTDFFTEGIALDWIAQEREVISTGVAIIDQEEREDRPGQQSTWAVTSKLPIYSKDGSIIGIAGISKDITSTRQELDRYRLAVGGARDGLWYRVLDGTATWFSSRWKD